MRTETNIEHFQSGFNRRREDQRLLLADTGFLRINQIVGPQGLVPVGKSTIWAWIKQGKFPNPVKLGPRTTVWQVAEVRACLKPAKREIRDALRKKPIRRSGLTQAHLICSPQE